MISLLNNKYAKLTQRPIVTTETLHCKTDKALINSVIYCY